MRVLSCPLLKEYTRECIEHFESLISFSDFEFCESDGYKDCIFYRTLEDPKGTCKYADRCARLHFDIPKEEFTLSLNDLNLMGKNFCFTENRFNCAIFKEFESGREVSPFLHPDGTMVKRA